MISLDFPSALPILLKAHSILKHGRLTRSHREATKSESRNCNAGFVDATFHRGLLWRGFSLRQSMPEVEVTMDWITVVALVLALLLLVHLTFSLLFPEKL